MKSKHSFIWLQNTTDIKEPNIKKEALKPVKDTLQKYCLLAASFLR